MNKKVNMKKNIFYNPDSVTVPGETLLDLLEERSMTQKELANRMGRPLKTINEIIKGKAAITSETAIQLERVLGILASFWNQREANYRSYLARCKEYEELTTQKDWLKQFPIKEMKKRGWLTSCCDTVADQMIAVLNFFGVATPQQWKAGWTKRKLSFRKAENVKTEIGAISVWLRKGEIEGDKIQCKPFDKEKLIACFPMIRSLTLEKSFKKIKENLTNICADCGVAVVFTQPFLRVPVYGASWWLTPEKALIQLSLRGKSADGLWFTVFHEIAHIVKHSKKEFFIEIEDKVLSKPQDELEADEYASECLISLPFLNEFINKFIHENRKPTKAAVCDFAKKLNVSPGIVVGRLQHLKYLRYSEFNDLKFKYEHDEY